jgi:hypothetical protein
MPFVFRPTAQSMRRTSALAVLTAALVAACSGSPTGTAARSDLRVIDRVPSGNQAADRAALDSAYRAVRALAAPGPCANGACTALPLGAKPCGGPWAYVSYCPTSPDAERLRAMAAELARVERAYNERYSVASTCDLAAEPANCRIAP